MYSEQNLVMMNMSPENNNVTAHTDQVGPMETESYEQMHENVHSEKELFLYTHSTVNVHNVHKPVSMSMSPEKNLSLQTENEHLAAHTSQVGPIGMNSYMEMCIQRINWICTHII